MSILNLIFCYPGIITEVDGADGKDPLVGDDAIAMDTIKKSPDQNEIPRDSITEMQTLGHGKIGRVYKARARGVKSDEKTTLIAVKEFQADQKENIDEFHTEVEMFTQLKHENVVRLIGVNTAESPWLLITDYGEEVHNGFHLFHNRFLIIQ